MSQATMGVSGAIPQLDVGTRRRAIVSSAVGNFVELYDFLIYGLFAAQIAANFFPAGNETADLLKAFAIYGVGFFMRPIGAIVIGAYGDKHGRKNALVLTVGLMAAAMRPTVSTSAFLRPCLSPYAPITMAPMGRMKKPTP